MDAERVPAKRCARPHVKPYPWVPASAGMTDGEDDARNPPCAYILASRRHGTLHIGVTSNLLQRIVQHREGLIPGFTRDYGVMRLVWYEPHETRKSAIVREKRLKQWRRRGRSN